MASTIRIGPSHWEPHDHNWASFSVGSATFAEVVPIFHPHFSMTSPGSTTANDLNHQNRTLPPGTALAEGNQANKLEAGIPKHISWAKLLGNVIENKQNRPTNLLPGITMKIHVTLDLD